MKKLMIAIVFLIPPFSVYAQKLDEKYHKMVTGFVSLVKQNKSKQISEMITYPLKREYPLPPVKSKEDFIGRYKEIFDDKLINLISSSNLNSDWTAVGWRGIMLKDGNLWLDYSGRLIAINYQSEMEKVRKDQLIKLDKQKLHNSLKDFIAPVTSLQTKKFKLRIDDLGNGNYRYASWLLSTKIGSKPNRILYNGKFLPDGSGGNHSYRFTKGNYRYECYISIMDEKDSPDGSLMIYKAGKKILSESATVN